MHTNLPWKLAPVLVAFATFIPTAHAESPLIEVDVVGPVLPPPPPPPIPIDHITRLIDLQCTANTSQVYCDGLYCFKYNARSSLPVTSGDGARDLIGVGVSITTDDNGQFGPYTGVFVSPTTKGC